MYLVYNGVKQEEVGGAAIATGLTKENISKGVKELEQKEAREDRQEKERIARETKKAEEKKLKREAKNKRKNDKLNKKNAKEVEEKRVAKLEGGEKLEHDIIELMGKDRIKSLNIFDTGYNNTVRLSFVGRDNLTTAFIREGMKMDMLDVLFLIQDSKIKFEDISIFVQFPTIDSYGNESTENIMMGRFSQETVDKLNKENKATIRADLHLISEEWEQGSTLD